MQEITREVLEELRALKAEQASCATADRHMERLRAILRKCRDDWQVLDSIPKVPMYRARTAEPRWLTREQFAALARKLPRHLRLAARLAVATGLRMRSQSHLSWDRIDTHAARAWVPGYQMKGGKALGIPLSKRALRTLRALKAMNPHSRFVHPAPGGGPTDDFNTRAFKSAVAAAALAPLRWHDLRHTWASWQVQAGTSLQELQELGGWASYSSVLRYAHLAPEHLAQAAERLWVRSRVAQKLAQRRAGSSGGGK